MITSFRHHCRLLSDDSFLISHGNGVKWFLEEFNKLCEMGFLDDALEAAEIMQQQGIFMTRNSAYSLLQEAEKRKSIECGRRLRSLILHRLDRISVLGDHLIRIFSCHKSLYEANWAFDAIEKPTSYTWAAIILTNAKLGQCCTALDLYHRMHILEIRTDAYAYVAVLKSCMMKKLPFHGRIIHAEGIINKLQLDDVMGSTLVHMYAMCEALGDACEVFDRLTNQNVVIWNAIISGYALCGNSHLALKYFEQMQTEGLKPNVVSWNAVLGGYVEHGDDQLALQCFDWMQQEGIEPDKVTFYSILKACANMRAVELGRIIHGVISKSRYHLDISIGSTLIHMYATCGYLNEACIVFTRLFDRDVISFNAMITAYSLNEGTLQAKTCFEKMQHEGIKANIESWNALIGGYSQHDDTAHLALECFETMQEAEIMPNNITFVNIMKACSVVGLKEKGKLVHAQIMKSMIQLDVVMGSALVDMYAKCGSLDDAYTIFQCTQYRNIITWNAIGYSHNGQGPVAEKYLVLMQQEGIMPNVASWNAIIAGYSQHGEGMLALQCFDKMQESIKPSEATYLSVVKACAVMGATEQGRLIHEQITKCRSQLDTVVGNSLLDMYAKCGCLEEAYKFSTKCRVGTWYHGIHWLLDLPSMGMALHVYNVLKKWKERV